MRSTRTAPSAEKRGQRKWPQRQRLLLLVFWSRPSHSWQAQAPDDPWNAVAVGQSKFKKSMRSCRQDPWRPSCRQPSKPALPSITAAEVDSIDSWWRACNYLTVGQIYLQDNPLLRTPLRPEHIKPTTARPLGHQSRPGFHLRPCLETDSPHQPTVRLPRLGPVTADRPWWPRAGWREPTVRSFRRCRANEAGMHRLVRQFSSPEASRATSRSPRQALSTREASSATCWSTRSAP